MRPYVHRLSCTGAWVLSAYAVLHAAPPLPPRPFLRVIPAVEEPVLASSCSAYCYSWGRAWDLCSIIWFGTRTTTTVPDPAKYPNYNPLHGDQRDNSNDVRVTYTPTDFWVTFSVMDQYLWEKPNINDPRTTLQFDCCVLALDTGHERASRPDANDWYFAAGPFAWDWGVRDPGWAHAFPQEPNYEARNNVRWARGTGTGWSLQAGATWYRQIVARFGAGGFNNNSLDYDGGMWIRMRIPWTVLNTAMPASGTVWGVAFFNYNVTEDSGTPRIQSWPPGALLDDPSTWADLVFSTTPFQPPVVNSERTLVIHDTFTYSAYDDAGTGAGNWNVVGNLPANRRVFDAQCQAFCMDWHELGRNWGKWGNFKTQAQGDPADFRCYSKVYLAFDISAIPSTCTVSSATLYLTCFAQDDGFPPPYASLVATYAVDDPWDELTVSWNTMPPPYGNYLNGVLVSTPGSTLLRYAWNVTEQVYRDQELRKPRTTIALYTPTHAYHSGKYFRSAQDPYSTAERPLLSVVWGNYEVPPWSRVTSPSSGAIFHAPATVPLAAEARDPDGTVARVEFFAGTTLLAADTSSPYTAVWTSVAAGTYTITARATDAKGLVAVSTPVVFRVNQPPTVRLLAPAYGAAFVTTDTIRLAALPADIDGTIAAVRFYSGTTLLATTTASPYVFDWTGMSTGTYTLSARAEDDDGASGVSSAAVITVNLPDNKLPVVAVTDPTDGALFVTDVTHGRPIDITVRAAATDEDGTIVTVAFYLDGVHRHDDPDAPYTWTWTRVASGTYVLSARATDDRGGVRISSQVTITVIERPNDPPSIALTAPADGAVFRHTAAIVVQADAADPDGHITQVRFFCNGTLFTQSTAPPFAASWTSPSTGTFSFRASARDNDNAEVFSGTATITVVEPYTVAPGEVVLRGGAGGYVRPGEEAALVFVPTEPGKVAVTVYTLGGRRIWTAELPVSRHQRYSIVWRGVQSDETPVPSGVYLAHVSGGGINVKKKIAVVR